MKASVPKHAHTTHCPTWDELVHRLALHLRWLHQSTPETKASRIKIERWHRQLSIVTNTKRTERAQKKGQP
jgi:hypothetical protein